jgi:hypothetical protein
VPLKMRGPITRGRALPASLRSTCHHFKRTVPVTRVVYGHPSVDRSQFSSEASGSALPYLLCPLKGTHMTVLDQVKSTVSNIATVPGATRQASLSNQQRRALSPAQSCPRVRSLAQKRITRHSLVNALSISHVPEVTRVPSVMLVSTTERINNRTAPFRMSACCFPHGCANTVVDLLPCPVAAL